MVTCTESSLSTSIHTKPVGQWLLQDNPGAWHPLPVSLRAQVHAVTLKRSAGLETLGGAGAGLETLGGLPTDPQLQPAPEPVFQEG